MKKKLFIFGTLLFMATFIGLNINIDSKENNGLSILLANVEALAENENSGSGDAVSIGPNESKVFNDCKNNFWTEGCSAEKGAKCILSGNGCTKNVSVIIDIVGIIVTLLTMFC